MFQVLNCDYQDLLHDGFLPPSLVLAHPHHDSGARGYSLFVAPGRLEDPAVAAFAQWLRTTAQAEGVVADRASGTA